MHSLPTCFKGHLCPASSDELNVSQMQNASQQPQNFSYFLPAELHHFHCSLKWRESFFNNMYTDSEMGGLRKASQD